MINIYGKTEHNGDQYGYGCYESVKTSFEAIMLELERLSEDINKVSDTAQCVEISASDDYMSVVAYRDNADEHEWEVHVYVDQPNNLQQDSYFVFKY